MLSAWVIVLFDVALFFHNFHGGHVLFVFAKFTLAIIFKVIILCLFMLFLHLSSFLVSRIFCLGVFILTLNKFFQIADLFLPLHFMGLCFVFTSWLLIFAL